MEDVRYPKQLVEDRPVRRRPGWPLERLPDGYNPEAEAGHLLA